MEKELRLRSSLTKGRADSSPRKRRIPENVEYPKYLFHHRIEQGITRSNRIEPIFFHVKQYVSNELNADRFMVPPRNVRSEASAQSCCFR
jgi:hypothetical protein